MAIRPRQGVSLASQFTAVAKARAAATAIVQAGRAVTYRELERHSAGLAARMSATTPPGSFVGICLPHGSDAVVAIVAAIRAGRAYVPLDPAYPPERLRYLLDDARPATTVVDERTRSLIEPHGRTMRVEPAGDDVGPPPEPAVDTPAYVIYTSGSTGRPKGVVINQSHVAALLSATTELFAFSQDDVWTLFHSINFDISVWEIWGALLHGARLAILDDEARLAPELLRSAIEDERVTVFNVVPSIFRELVADTGELLPWDPPLRYIIFGGEPVHLPSVSAFRARCAASPVFVNMYGITETTVHVTAHILSTEDEQRPAVSPIGRALPHLEIRLLDEARRDVPLGETGEMWIGGAAVADGYLRRPELTAERFVWLGSGEEPRRYYRSGDLARMSARGVLEYIGRTDDQVTVRGFRIELGEIEACLEALPDVSAAAATVETGPAGSPFLVAYFVPRWPPPADGLGRRLRESLRRTLPAHLVPGRLVPVPSLPRTLSGKLDRRHLTEAEAAEWGGHRHRN